MKDILVILIARGNHKIYQLKMMCFVSDGLLEIFQSGGPSWDVPKGRKDGRTSLATETRQLPAPTFNISQLQQSFSQRGLSMKNLVALSGN